MRGSRNFCLWGVPARLPENSSDNVFLSPQLLLQFYSGLSMVYLKKTIIFQGLRGGPTFFRGFNIFQEVGSKC